MARSPSDMDFIKREMRKRGRVLSEDARAEIEAGVY